MKTTISSVQIAMSYALLFSGIAALWLTVVQPGWEDYTERRSNISSERLRLQRLEHAVANDTALDPDSSGTMLEQLGVYIGETSLTAQTADIAGSILRQRLLTLAREHDGKIGDTRISSGPDPSMVTVTLNLTIDLAGLKGVLYDLESSRPFVFVDVLSVRYPGRVEVQDMENISELATQINVSSYWLESPTVGGGS